MKELTPAHYSFPIIKSIIKTVFCLNKVIVKHTADAASAFKDIVSNIKFKF